MDTEKESEALIVASKELMLQKEAKQKQASQYARSLLEASLDPLVTISVEGKITDVNEASVKVTGVSRNNLIDTDFSNYFTEPKKAREGYQQVFEKGFVANYPLTIKHTDGKLTDVLYNASIYKDDLGNVLGVFAAARDITSQKQASQYARSLIEASLDPLVTISAEGKITDVNEASVKVTGVSRERLIGTDFSDYFTEPQKAQEGYQQVFEKGFVSDYPLTIKHKSGKLSDVLYNASVYKDDKGKVLGVFAAARDITSQKQAELVVANKKLEQQNKEKENRANELITANKELEYQNDEKEKRAEELTIANKELAFQSTQKEKRADELAEANKELAFQNTQKEQRAAELTAANKALAMQIEEKERLSAALVMVNKELAYQNIEKEKRAAELIIANKELEQFVYIASHDLQEPLRTISNYMQVFEEDYIEQLDYTALNYLHSVNNATVRMSMLIRSFLDFSRLGINRKLSEVNCKELIRDVIADLDTIIKTSNATIEVSAMPTLKIYETEIRQLFQNLLTNAIKFQDKGKAPFIQINSKQVDDHWQFSVSDNGIGIDPISFDRVFTIFQRLSTAANYEGNGIGLANCKKIVQLHQGKIWIDSAPGKGTTFYFTIPNQLL